MDSGMTSSREDDAHDFFEFSISPGQYSIATVDCDPNDNISMLINRFIEVSS